MTGNVAASVHQRLLNRARVEGRPFDELLQHYALERLLYRLGRSSYARQFVLKGALMFGAWQGSFARPTRDVDLLGHLDNSVEQVMAAVSAICQQPVAGDDGLRFQIDGIRGERITEAAEYQGVRVRVPVTLGRTRLSLQMDVGFGDALVPGPSWVRLPTLLDDPPPEIQGYSRETTIAEKLQAMVTLGEVNSRMKDFYDLWFLATRFAFGGAMLTRAVRETFQRRQTNVPPAVTALGEAFARDEGKQGQWAAFIGRHQLKDAPAALEQAIQAIAAFLSPVIQALHEGQPFDLGWQPGGPWSAQRHERMER